MGRWYTAQVARRFQIPFYSFSNGGILVGGFKGGRGDGNLKFLKIPGILVQPLVVSNPSHANWAVSDEGQRRLASILTDSIRLHFPQGGRICFSVGHKYKKSSPHDRGASVYGGGTEAGISERVLELAARILEEDFSGEPVPHM